MLITPSPPASHRPASAARADAAPRAPEVRQPRGRRDREGRRGHRGGRGGRREGHSRLTGSLSPPPSAARPCTHPSRVPQGPDADSYFPKADTQAQRARRRLELPCPGGQPAASGAASVIHRRREGKPRLRVRTPATTPSLPQQRHPPQGFPTCALSFWGLGYLSGPKYEIEIPLRGHGSYIT